MIAFPVDDLLNEQACCEFLLQHLHPEGLRCPKGHPLPAGAVPHDRHRAPIMDYRCKSCGSVFNLFTKTLWTKTSYRCSQIVQILRGFAQGTPTLHLARELHVHRGTLLERRHRMQRALLNAHPDPPKFTGVVEADEMYENSGEKGTLHPDPEDPPRRRGNKVRGHGCWENDRIPILGVVDRSSGQLSLKVVHSCGAREVHPEMLKRTRAGTIVNTDEWNAYDFLERVGRIRRSVCHKKASGGHEWARDDDGDGIREVHCNTSEGLWTGLRNFLRPFRGLHKKYLAQYVAVFEWAHNLKTATFEFIAALLGVAHPVTG